MKIRYNFNRRFLLVLLFGLLLVGCGDKEEAQVSYDPVAFHGDDGD